MRWFSCFVVLSVSLVSGCQPAPATDAGGFVDGPVGIDVFVVVPDAFAVPPDAFEPPDTPRYVDGARVYLDGETAPDAYLAYDGGNLCGFDAAADTFVCGGSDAWPADCESGTYCCHGTCDPFGHDQVCCDRSTGEITLYRYTSGMCPLRETTSCS